MVKKLKPVFSIILPTYNGALTIVSAIESVLAQTFSNFELLVVNDGSTDTTKIIVEKYAKRDKRVKLFSFPKGAGFGYENRNKVFKKAKGKYLAFMAHDDIWFQDHLEILFNFFQSNLNYEVAYTRPVWAHPDGTLIVSTFNTNDSETKKVLLNIHNEIPAGCLGFRLESVKKLGYLNSKLQKDADWDLTKRVIRGSKNKSIGFITIPTNIHFKAVWKTKDNFWNERLEGVYKIVKKDKIISKSLNLIVSKNGIAQKKAQKLVLDQNWATRVREDFITTIDAITQKLAYINANNIKLKSDMKRMRATKGYKLLEKYRKILRNLKITK